MRYCNSITMLALVLVTLEVGITPADEPKTGEQRDTLLYVRTDPSGARVLLDGKELGESDGLFPVDPGVGTIVVELDGCKPTSKKITIHANKVNRVELELKRQSDSNSGGGNAATLSQEGWQLWQKGEFNKAADKFQAAVKLNSKNADSWNGLGWATFNSGKIEEAIEPFRHAIKLNPTHPGALNGLGQIFFALKKYDEAENFLLKAAPQAPAAWFGLARLYLLQGKFEEAEKYAQMIVDSGQGDKISERMLGAAKEKRLPDGLRVMIEPRFSKPFEDAKKPTDPSLLGPNILTNAGFEEGDVSPKGWKQGADIPGVKYTWDKRVGFNSKESLRIEKTENRYFPIAQWSQTVDRTENATELEISAQVRARKMTKAILDVLFLDKDGQWISHKWAAYIGSKEDGDPPADHNWKPYIGKVEVPPGTAKLCIGLQVYGPGKVWFDDVQARYVKPEKR